MHTYELEIEIQNAEHQVHIAGAYNETFPCFMNITAFVTNVRLSINFLL